MSKIISILLFCTMPILGAACGALPFTNSSSALLNCKKSKSCCNKSLPVANTVAGPALKDAGENLIITGLTKNITDYLLTNPSLVTVSSLPIQLLIKSVPKVAFIKYFPLGKLISRLCPCYGKCRPAADNKKDAELAIDQKSDLTASKVLEKATDESIGKFVTGIEYFISTSPLKSFKDSYKNYAIEWGISTLQTFGLASAASLFQYYANVYYYNQEEDVKEVAGLFWPLLMISTIKGAITASYKAFSKNHEASCKELNQIALNTKAKAA